MHNYIGYILSAYGIVFAVLGWLWYSAVKSWQTFMSNYSHGDVIVAENHLNKNHRRIESINEYN